MREGRSAGPVTGDEARTAGPGAEAANLAQVWDGQPAGAGTAASDASPRTAEQQRTGSLDLRREREAGGPDLTRSVTPAVGTPGGAAAVTGAGAVAPAAGSARPGLAQSAAAPAAPGLT
ncbi:hypothetical protein AB4225_11420, partial [Streptomyces sp. 2RAF24]